MAMSTEDVTAIAAAVIDKVKPEISAVGDKVDVLGTRVAALEASGAKASKEMEDAEKEAGAKDDKAKEQEASSSTLRAEATQLRAATGWDKMTDAEKAVVTNKEQEATTIAAAASTLRREASQIRKAVKGGILPSVLNAMSELVTDVRTDLTKLMTDTVTPLIGRLATDGRGTPQQGGLNANSPIPGSPTPETPAPERKTLSASAIRMLQGKFDGEINAGKQISEQALDAHMRAAGISTNDQIALKIELQRGRFIGA